MKDDSPTISTKTATKIPYTVMPKTVRRRSAAKLINVPESAIYHSPNVERA